MAKKIISTITILLLTFITKVNAQQIYYINDNNVILNEEEYNFISEVFYDGYQDLLTITDYNNIFTENIINSRIQKKSIEPNNYFNPLANDMVSSANKSVTITSVCTSNCLITILAEWKSSPSVRSYDLIGAYLSKTNLVIDPVTTISSSSGSSNSSEIVKKSNGFGVSVKLPSSGSNIKITQYFRVKTGGTVYGSYQHAIKDITLTNSKKYSIDYSGYGNVFLFNTSTIKDYYDGMAGVNIEV